MVNIELSKENYAAIYARKSTIKDSGSIESQLALCKEFAIKNNLVVLKSYWDEESATKFRPTHRKGFQELLRDVEEGKFGTLIVYRRDRLARNADDFIFIRNLLRTHDIKILYSNPGEFQTSDDEKSLFIENMLMAIDELEPKVIQERAAIGRREKRKRGEISFTGRPPYGYYADEVLQDCSSSSTNEHIRKKTEYKVDSDKATIVTKIYENYLESDDSLKLKDFVFLVQSFPEIAEKDKKLFSRDKIVDILTNYAYAGLMFGADSLKKHNIRREEKLKQLFCIDNESNEVTINYDMLVRVSNIPNPIIDKEVWYKAATKWFRQARKTSRIRKDYLLQDLLVCKQCKKTVILKGYPGNARYRCEASGCTSIKQETLEPLIINKLVNDLLSTNDILSFCKVVISNKNKLMNKRNQMLIETKKTIDMLINKLIDNPMGNEDIQQLLEKYASKETLIQESIIRLERNIRKVNDFIEDKEKLLEIAQKGKSCDDLCISVLQYANENFKDFQTLLNSLIKKVTISGNEQGDKQLSVEYHT